MGPPLLHHRCAPWREPLKSLTHRIASARRGGGAGFAKASGEALMKVVIGGASGLIGRRLVEHRRGRGDEVVALVRRRDPAAPWAQGARLEEWDGKALGAWCLQLNGADAVVNLAGASVAGKRWSAAWKQEILGSRIDSTFALVQAMAAAARKRRAFVSGNAVGYYGPRGDEPLD